MKTAEDVMEILEAFDAAESFHAAAWLAGCDDKTVARYVRLREEGRVPGVRVVRARLIDPFLPKIEEWVHRSKGRVRAKSCHRRLQALGYNGSRRTTRRALAEMKKAYRRGHGRLYRPWITEPGLWFQWDWADGPRVEERPTWLWCAWLAWSRFRVVLPVRDKSLPTLVACLDATLREFGGCPTYGLTDNERTVTIQHVAGIPVRNPDLVAVARYYGLTIATCARGDAETKGGVEATVRIAKDDLVPTEMNLREGYRDFAELEAACRAFCDGVNQRVHRVTRRRPVEMLAEERQRLHPIPSEPHTVAFGETRSVGWNQVLSWKGVPYSLPEQFVGETVWCREHGDELVIVAVVDGRPREVERHNLSTPGNPGIKEEHYPLVPAGPLGRQPKPQLALDAAFLAIGAGAHEWLLQAAAEGVLRIERKMEQAVEFAKLYGREAVDRALAEAAAACRFAEGDLPSILHHHRTLAEGRPNGGPRHHDETWSLQPGTSAWNGVGR